MADDAIQVTIGADASGLVNAVGGSKVALQSLSHEFEMLRRSIADSSALIVNELGSSLKGLQGNLNSVAPAADRATTAMRAFHAASSGGGGGGGHGGGGWGPVIFEARALFDEIASGRSRQALGTFARFETFLFRVSPELAIAAVAVVGLGLAFKEAANYVYGFQETAKDTRQALAFSGNAQFIDPKAIDEAANKLRDLKSIWNTLGLSDKGFSEAEISKVASSFAQMGDTSNDTIKGMALAMSAMWQQFGSDEKEASKNIVEVFSKPLAPIDEIAKHLHGLTDEERARLKAAQDTASPLNAQAAILDILAQRERAASAAKAQSLRDQIAAQQQVVDEVNAQDGASASLLHDQTDYLNSLKEQLSVVDKIGDILQSQADKMRSMLEPAQNIANAMRDWTKKADPRAAQSENVDEEIKKGEAALKQMRDAASSSGGESPFGGLINSEDYAKASAALDALKAKRDATFEKDSRKDVELGNLQSQADGQANAVNEAQRLRDESADYFSRMNKPASETGEQADLYREAQQRKLDDEKKLAEAKRAFAESQLALEVANAGKSVAARSAAELKLNEVKRQGADGDPTKLNEVAADRARILQQMNDDSISKAANKLDEEIAKVRDDAAQKVKLYQEDVRVHTLTAQEGADAEKVVLQEEETNLSALFARKAALYVADSNERGKIEKETQKELRAIEDQIAQEQRQAADASAKSWQSGAQDVLSAWNSNLRGLLSGTENFGTAMRKTVADLVLQLIEGFEKFALNAVLQYTVINHAAGASAAVQVAANESAAAGGMSAIVGNAIKAISADAAMAFGGVFANLSPILGPLAIGPAAAAQATVAAVAGSVASADIGMWNVPQDQLALIHHNELIMPAAQAGAFRDMLSGGGARGDGGGQGGPNVSVSPQMHVHVSANDGASVAQWARNNAGDLAKAMHQASRQGAMLGLRKFSPA